VLAKAALAVAITHLLCGAMFVDAISEVGEAVMPLDSATEGGSLGEAPPTNGLREAPSKAPMRASAYRYDHYNLADAEHRAELREGLVTSPKKTRTKTTKGESKRKAGGKHYESLPRLPASKFTPSAGEAYAEKMASTYFNFGKGKEAAAAQKAAKASVVTERKISQDMMQAQKEAKVVNKWDHAAKQEMKAKDVNDERKDAQKAWHDEKKVAQAVEALPRIARKAWNVPKMHGKGGIFSKLHVKIPGVNSDGTVKKVRTEPGRKTKNTKPAHFRKRKAKTPTTSKPRKKNAKRPKSEELGSDSGDVAEGISSSEEADEESVAHELPAVEELLDVEETPQTQKSTPENAKKVIQRAVKYEQAARKMAAEGAAQIGIAEKRALTKLAIRHEATAAESKALKVKSQRVASKLAKQEKRIQQQKLKLHAEAEAQKKIFDIQEKNAAQLRAEVDATSPIAKAKAEEQKLAVKKAALDAQARTQQKILTQQKVNTHKLKAEVNTVRNSERDALLNAERLGEAKAHAADEAKSVLKAAHEKALRRSQKAVQQWTIKNTAKLGKVMVVTQAVDAALARKTKSLADKRKKLKQLRNMLTEVATRENMVESKDKEIQRSTVELSREELGESASTMKSSESQDLDLGESSDVTDSDDSIGVSLAKMSAQFASIQHRVNDAASEEMRLERSTAMAKKAKESASKHKIQHRESTNKSMQKQKVAKKLASNKSQQLEKKLAREEATLRQTTVAKVKAQYNLQNAVNQARAHAKKLGESRHPITQLTPEMETREEYQRMYVQNVEQQALQKRTELQNKLADLKGNDARHLKVLVDDIREKRKVLKSDIGALKTLSGHYQEDHELGEGLHDTHGAATLANAIAKMQKQNTDDEAKIIAQTDALSNELNDRDVGSETTLSSAKDVLKSTAPTGMQGHDIGETAGGIAQVHLASELAAARTALKMKTNQLRAMSKQNAALASSVRDLHNEAVNAKAREYESESHTGAMRQITKAMSDRVERNEENLELSETLFARESSKDLGESGSTGQTAPIQAELDYEQEAMAKAQAQIRRITETAPKLMKEQIATDNKVLGAKLKAANAKLNKLHSHFVNAAKMLSPKITSQVALDDAVRMEQSRQDDYQRNLKDVRSYANKVTVKEKEAYGAIQGAQ